METEEFKKPELNTLSRPKVKTSNSDLKDVNKLTEPGAAEEVTEITPVPPIPKFHEARDADAESENVEKAKYSAMLSQLKYKEPSGCGPIDTRYSFEVLKNGSIVDTIKFTDGKSFYVVGRLSNCCIVGEHPTISRIHAILQYIDTPSEDEAEKDTKERGLYIYDLKSTHGTFLNKNRLLPNKYYRLRVGHVLKFGSSSRIYILMGPAEDEEEEHDKTVTELMKERNDKEIKRKKANWKGNTDGGRGESDEEEDGISWGMGQDAIEESGLNINPFALDYQESKELSLDNPKRTLHTWFEREGYDLHYNVQEKGNGHFSCTINLPLDGPTGVPIIAEFDGKGKKKEIMVQCAVKACQILDKYGVLRKSNQEGYKRKTKDWEENDYYSSDEDTFLDRTGSVEQKRRMRMKQAGKIEDKAETFDSLVDKYNSIQKDIDSLNTKLIEAEAQAKKDAESVDPLDAYMLDLKSGVVDIRNMKIKIKELTEEQTRILKLINIVKGPGVVFPLDSGTSNKNNLQDQQPPEKKIKILFGPRKGVATSKSITVSKPIVHKVEASESKTIPEFVDVEAEEEIRHQKSLHDDQPLVTEVAVPLRQVKQQVIQPDDESDEETEDATPDVTQKAKKKRRIQRQKKEVTYEYDESNPDYSVWVPPSDQKGDGKTKLNEKLGY